MSRIFIFGDSFCWKESYFTEAWPYKLSSKFEVFNYAEGGYSNSEIFLEFLRRYEQMTESDVVIFSWSDPNRFYVNPEVKKTSNIAEIFYSHFYNKKLNEFFQKKISEEIKKMILDKKLRALFFWSFPSDYRTDKENQNWVHSILEDYHFSNYTYFDNFENEVKPALIYFSKKEALSCKTSNEVIEFFTKDGRPNHIGDQSVHDTILSIIEDFVNHKISGQIDLNDYIKHAR